MKQKISMAAKMASQIDPAALPCPSFVFHFLHHPIWDAQAISVASS
jgi:hypothetical protein